MIMHARGGLLIQLQLLKLILSFEIVIFVVLEHFFHKNQIKISENPV